MSGRLSVLPPLAFDPDRLTARLWRFDEESERFGVARSKDLLDAPNVRIVLHANAVHLQAGPEAPTIRHVVVRPLGGEAREVKARHYVLACGAIENARLLLASNDVEAAGIGNRQDQVGRYFMEHPCGRIGRVHTDAPLRDCGMPSRSVTCRPGLRLPRCCGWATPRNARPAPSTASSPSSCNAPRASACHSATRSTRT